MWGKVVLHQISLYFIFVGRGNAEFKLCFKEDLSYSSSLTSSFIFFCHRYGIFKQCLSIYRKLVPLLSLIIDTQKDGCENYLNVDHQFLICWLADLIIIFFFRYDFYTRHERTFLETIGRF